MMYIFNFITFILFLNCVSSNIALECWFGSLGLPHSKLNGVQPKECGNLTSVSHCLSFEFIQQVKGTDWYNGKHPPTKAHTDLSCDLNHYCDKAKPGFNPKFTINGDVGNLYCCSKSKCNNPNNLPHTPNLVCYKGKSVNGKPEGTTSSQTCDSGVCVNTTWVDKNGTKVSFFNCDQENYCQHKNIPLGTCKKVNEGGHPDSIRCCCSSHICNLHNHSFLIHHLKSLALSFSHKSKALLTAVVVSTVILVLLLILAVFITVRVNQRRKNRQGLSISYSHLTSPSYSDLDSEGFGRKTSHTENGHMIIT